MEIAATRSPATLAPDGTGKAPAPRKQLGEDDFLKLLTTQLANQDPLSPMDNQAFIAQLAQFASVQQLTQVGDRLDTLLLAQASANQLDTANLVGKGVDYLGDDGSKASGLVTGVEFSDGVAKLIVGDALIPLSNVTAVHQG